MAISLPKLQLYSISNKFQLPQNSVFSGIHFLSTEPKSKKTFQLKSHGPSSSMSSIITKLGREQVKNKEDEQENPEELPQPATGLSTRWRKIAGQDDWADLLDPIDPLVRTELIRYGEMAQACYDAFDFDPFSKYCASCKYNRRYFFQSLGMPDAGYDITRYLYATSDINLPNFLKRSRWPRTWSDAANWIGFVAVSNDEMSTSLGRRDIVVAWRGTATMLEWLADLTDYLKPVKAKGIPCPESSVKVESGFLDLYTAKRANCRFCKYSAREQVLAEIKRLVHLYTSNGEELSISLTGHSLGSALATLSAYDIAETGANIGTNCENVPIIVYSFSGPRVGNGPFKDRFEKTFNIKALRVVNVHDTVPKVPGIVINENVPQTIRNVAEKVLPWWSYTHVGVELLLDHKHSPFLKPTSDPACFHNLEAHLHLLDGYHGKGERFVLVSKRDPALVNKACDFLKDHHLVPPHWRQDENKGMVVTDGKWVVPERRFDDHPHDMHHYLQDLGLL